MRRHLILAAAIALLPAAAIAQPRPDPTREALRETLVRQAREARAREDYAACSAYLDAATQIRSDTLVRYGSALCARYAGLFPEARRYANACLAEPEGDPALRGECRRVLDDLDAMERERAAPQPPVATPAVLPAPQPPRPAAVPLPPVTRAIAPATPRAVPVGAVVLLAAGGAALAASAVGLALYGDAFDGCGSPAAVTVCSSRDAATRAADAGTWATVTEVTFGVGLALAAGGAAWWIAHATRGGAPREAPRVTGAVLPGGAALAVRF